MRRVVEVSGLVAGTGKQIPRSARDDNKEKSTRDDNTQKQIEAAGETARRTVPLPSILTSGAPTLMRAGVMPKPTPANLRRFAELPIARRAINTIKDRVAGMQWRIEPRRGRTVVSHPVAKGGRQGWGTPPEDGSQKTDSGKTGLSGAPEDSGSHPFAKNAKGWGTRPSEFPRIPKEGICGPRIRRHGRTDCGANGEL